MTVGEAITKIDALRTNQYTTAQKVDWLSAVDGQIFIEIIKTHHNPDIHHFNGYSASDTTDVLIVPEPYAEDFYTSFLMMQIDRANAEFEKYNQSVVMYNNALLTFRNWYNKTHMPLNKGRFRW